MKNAGHRFGLPTPTQDVEHTAHGRTMEAAEILATLAAGHDPDWLPNLTVSEEPEESPLEVLVALAEEADAEIPDDTSADAEVPGVQMCQSLGIQARSHL